MKAEFSHIRIAGVLGVVPETVSRFDDELPNYSHAPANSLKLKAAMGYNEHRVARARADYAREKFPRIKVILMTGYAEQAAMTPQFLGAHMELLVKPFDAQALVAKVHAALVNLYIARRRLMAYRRWAKTARHSGQPPCVGRSPMVMAGQQRWSVSATSGVAWAWMWNSVWRLSVPSIWPASCSPQPSCNACRAWMKRPRRGRSP